MKKAWKVILIIVLAAILAGVILIAAGYLTGADTSRIYEGMDQRYQLANKIEYYKNVSDEAFSSIFVFGSPSEAAPQN
ncbi:MAG: hypothetical protein MJ135_05375 [Oscillospiraceae bacterium]|nr:hypothetical protein [Oscillospiraceae bacterium]